ncbi:MAG: hypothetical protein FWD61_11625 [Phycisphaerales bacterium]|nr:hypothetical protein [Phycisphaerales bacterium]
MCFAKFLRDKAQHGDAFWCVAPSFDKSVGAAGGQQKELWDALPRWMFKDQTWDEKTGFTHRKVVLPTQDDGQCVVEFRSSDQAMEMFEAGRLRGVWCDERLPEEIYDRLLARIIDLDGFLIYSDIYEQWWHFERLVSAKPEAGIRYQHFTMHDNSHNLSPGAIERVSERWTEDQKNLRIHGLMVRMEGLVFKNSFDPQRHLVRPFPIPDYWPRWRLIDYGSSAPTACLWVALSEDEIAYAYREYYDRGHIIAHNARMIIGMSGNEKYRQTLIDPHAVDKPPAVHGLSQSVADQYATAGIKTTGWPYIHVMGEHACVEKVKLGFEQGKLKIYSTCENFVKELNTWKYLCDKDGKPLASDSYENDNNHLIDCCKGWLATSPTFARSGIVVVDGSE